MVFKTLKNKIFLPLATERLLLRPVQQEDADAITILANNYNVSKTLATMPYPYALQDAIDFISRKEKEMEEGKPELVLSILDRTSHQFLGCISCENGTVGYWLGEPFWGQGLMKEAFRTFIHFLFETCEIPEFEISVKPTNIGSVRIIEGAGCVPTHQKEIRSNSTQSLHLVQFYKLTREQYWENYRAQKTPIVWAAAAAILKDQKLLLAERPLGKSMTGAWELPGGKIEPGETPEVALARELHEELGIEVLTQDLKPLTFVSYAYANFHLVMPFFILTHWNGNLHGKEGQKLAWVAYGDLENYPMPPAGIPLVHKLYDEMKPQGLWG